MGLKITTLEPPIYVQTDYDDDYLLRLWLAIRADYDRYSGLGKQTYRRRNEPADGRKRRYGPALYMKSVVIPEIEKRRTSAGIRMKDKADYCFTYPNFGADFSLVSGYLEAVGNGTRPMLVRPNPVLVRVFDAYAKIVAPALAATFAPQRELEATGEVTGGFLIDMRLQIDRYAAALAQQDLRGIYRYREETPDGRRLHRERFAVFLRSESVKFLYLYDFHMELMEEIAGAKHDSRSDVMANIDERLALYYGFVIPGTKLSPVVLRSFCLRFGQTGTLFGLHALLEDRSLMPDTLSIHTYTAEFDEIDLRSSELVGNQSDEEALGKGKRLAQAATMAMFGPRARRYQLLKVEDPKKIKKITNRLDRFKRDYL